MDEKNLFSISGKEPILAAQDVESRAAQRIPDPFVAGLGLLISCLPQSELVQGLVRLSLGMPTSVITADISQGPRGREKNHVTFVLRSKT